MSASDRLARQLVLDEIFDLSLYKELRAVARGGLREVLEELIRTETRHVAFWQEFFALQSLVRLDVGRRLKLAALVTVCRLFGNGGIQVVLEAIEVHGVRKYLSVWDRYRDGPLGGAVRQVLEDEFKHEDMVVTGEAERQINPERVRNVFLGLNDGLVEILGAVSGFFAAFGKSIAVLAAGLTVAVAGALSMGAGAYIAASSEGEVRATEDERRRFLGETPAGAEGEGPMASALVVGLGYFAGALVPVLPVLFGAQGMLPTVLTAGTTIIAVSAVVAFLSGMDVHRRILMNVLVTGIAVAVTYAIGLLAKAVWGIAL
ncbi:MAG TPA: VIT1/CCC1 transporter family protein [Vicinamibacteria bacterium]|nr:VIT1/CCC1 transporter family protein [Vicinamibacteria bacterium]